MCAVGKFRKIWGQAPSDECPHCGKPEDALHVYCCPSQVATEAWTQRLSEFGDWLDSVDTSPAVTSTLLALLDSWKQGSSFPYLVPQEVLLAAQDQRIVGCRGLMEGLLSIKWSAVQDAHYRQIGSRRTGSRWASLVVHCLWQFGFQLWEHQNSCLHSEELVANRRLSAKLNKAIHAEYRHGTAALPPSALYLFRLPEAKRKGTALIERERWLTLMTQERAASRRCARELRRQRREFTHYLNS